MYSIYIVPMSQYNHPFGPYYSSHGNRARFRGLICLLHATAIIFFCESCAASRFFSSLVPSSNTCCTGRSPTSSLAFRHQHHHCNHQPHVGAQCHLRAHHQAHTLGQAQRQCLLQGVQLHAGCVLPLRL
jgi:hypothetical protein